MDDLLLPAGFCRMHPMDVTLFLWYNMRAFKNGSEVTPLTRLVHVIKTNGGCNMSRVSFILVTFIQNRTYFSNRPEVNSNVVPIRIVGDFRCSLWFHMASSWLNHCFSSCFHFVPTDSWYNWMAWLIYEHGHILCYYFNIYVFTNLTLAILCVSFSTWFHSLTK